MALKMSMFGRDHNIREMLEEMIHRDENGSFWAPIFI